MDTLIENGDFKLNSRGYPIRIDGENELMQQILIRLLCKKGSFIYNPNLGSELYKLKNIYSNETTIKSKAIEYTKEALKNIQSVSVLDVNILSDINPDRLVLCFILQVNGKNKELEIEI